MMLQIQFLLVLAVFAVFSAETTSHLSSGPHIADVNILLPPKITIPVEYRLQGSDGCFKWSWDHHDILSVVPEYNISSHCSTSARLRSIASFSGRKETAVYAADVKSGIVIRIKVFIDNISRIQIFHNSVKLDLDGLATLRVRAFDAEDNEFSSLVGLQFMWYLLPESGVLPHHLAHVPLKESPLSDCGGLCGDLNIRIKLEDSGVFSDLYAVKGIGIGHENVSVHLLEPQFKHMADKVVLTVAEAMSLEPPSPVFVLINSALQYSLKVIRGIIPQVVALPSPHHSWSVSNSSVAEVDFKTGLARALNLGVTTVIVEDTRVAGHIQMSSLNVVLPDTLRLYMMPLFISGYAIEEMKAISSAETWYVVSGRQYRVQMKVFSRGPDAHEIFITENDDLKLHDQSDRWTTFVLSEDSDPGWHNSRILKATAQGPGELLGSLTYFVGHQEKREVIEVVQDIIVCDQVKFILDKSSGTSQTIILPWAPAVYQDAKLKAAGGCAKASSDYQWFSSDVAILSVSAFGVVQAKKPGKATVRVVSVFDSFNYDEVTVEVSIPSSIIMLQNFPVETVVGSHLHAAVTMKASNGASFYTCSAFHSFTKWKTGSESFVVVNVTEDPFILLENLGKIELNGYGPPCSWAYVYASASGQTMLHATLSKELKAFDHSFHGSVVLKASRRIAAYPPLILHQASDGNQYGGYWFDLVDVGASSGLEKLEVLYLVPGTSLDVILQGGPEPWDNGVKFTEYVEIYDEKQINIIEGAQAHPASGRCQSVYRISCQTLGTFQLVFKRGNMVGDDHPLPAIAEIVLPLTCSIPSSIVLIADEPVNSREAIRVAALADRSTGKIHSTPITVANAQTIRVAAVGMDTSLEPFANSSSLSLKWELSNCERLAYWDNANEAKMSKSNWEKFLVLQNETGECVVRAAITGFQETMGGSFSAKLPTLAIDLTDGIRLQIVSTLRVNPEFNLLFFSPSAKANLSIIGGSCFLESAVNDSNVIEVIQSPPSLQCSQLTLSPKGLGTAVVTVYDVGLVPAIVASSVVQVAEVDWIKIVSDEEISLMEGQSASIDLMAGISDGRTFDLNQLTYMDIHVWIEDDIVELVDGNVPGTNGGYVHGSKFKITAKDLGITTLYVSAKQHSGHEILSQPIKIEVYAPLRIHPQDIFLVPGSSYLLTVKGGPTIGVHVEYASLDDGTATVDRSSGLLSAISPGNTTILSTVYGNADNVICQAYGTVKVGVPSAAILNVQSEQLDIGTDVPIYPSFPEGDLFSFYERCKNFRWTVDDEKVLGSYTAKGLHGEKDWSQLNDEKELGFIKVFSGRSAGRTSVAVTFSCDFVSTSYSENRLYNASISLLVIPDLPLALGVPVTWILPPHYITHNILPSSLESHGQWDGQSQKGTITYSLLRSSVKNEGLHKDTIFIDGDRIKTMDSGNLACIQGKDRTTGRIEIASCVRVAEVAQIRIMSKEFPFRVIHLAVGAALDLPISYFDASGNAFYEAHNVAPFNAEINYHDIVSIDDTKTDSEKIHLKAMQYGRALLRVSFKSNPQKSDFVLISVGAHLFPQNPVLHQGTSLVFSVEGIDNQVSGHWLSANESVITIDTSSGKAKAVGIGSTQVTFESPSMKLQTPATVLLGNMISIDAPREMLTNVPYPTKGYSFSVKFSDGCNELDAGKNSKEISYHCKVDPPFVGYAKPWIDLHTGNSYCLFFPYSPEHLVQLVPRLKDMRPYISVSIDASLREASHISGSASALFVGGFSILEMDKDVMQLNLTPDSTKSVLTVLGNSDVDIQWHNKEVIKITPVHMDDLGTGGRVQYEVKVLKSKRFKDKIIIMLPANGQRVEIVVNYEPDMRSESKPIFKGVIFTTIVACLAALVAMIIFYRKFFRTSSRTQPHPTPATPNVPVPCTPDRSTPLINEQSPRTPPQPFVDYVRQTIDETPYYKREARRRFNPQHTY